MEKVSSLQNLQALSDLLCLPANKESDAEDCKNVNLMAQMGPGQISAPSSASRHEKPAGVDVPLSPVLMKTNKLQLDPDETMVFYDVTFPPTEAVRNRLHQDNSLNTRTNLNTDQIYTLSGHYISKRKVNSTYVNNIKNIWDVEEVTERTHFDDFADPRPQPEYEIILKQSVGTGDLFLSIGQKNPSFMYCESMLVRVKLPETLASDIVLDVKKGFVDLRTPKYKLGLHLPYSLHHSKEGTARFITERYELEITLTINRPQESIILT